MTDIVYNRAIAREATIWNPFEYNGPFNSTQESNRTTLFGLYANTYLHGHNYLSEIETEDLAKLVDTYNTAIARITNEEAQLVLEVAAKRYVERIEDQIHDQKMDTMRDRIEALDDEYDAKIDALDADYAALETKRQDILLARDKMANRITELEARTQIEEVNQEMVDLDITEQELKAARADLQVIEAGLRGLDIQLAITQAGIDLQNTQLDVTQIEQRESQVDVDLAEIDLQEQEVDIQVAGIDIQTSEEEAQGLRIKSDTKRIAVQEKEVEVDLAEVELEQDKIQARTTEVNTQITEVGVRKTETEIEGEKIQTRTRGVEVDQTEVGIATSEAELEGQRIQLETSKVDLRVSEAELAQQDVALDGQKIDVDTSKSLTRVSELELQVEEIGAEESQLDAQIAGIKADTARLGLVNSELTIAQANQRIEQIESDLILEEQRLIASKQENVDTETGYVEEEQTTQEDLDSNRIDHENAKHGFEVDMIEAETELEDTLSDKRIQVLDDDKRNIIDQRVDRKVEDEHEKARLHDIRAQAAIDYKDAAIEAARDLAEADIVNTLTHSVDNA